MQVFCSEEYSFIHVVPDDQGIKVEVKEVFPGFRLYFMRYICSTAKAGRIEIEK